MKKLLIALAAVALIAPQTTNAQDMELEEPYFYQNVLSISPFHFFDQTFMLSYERLFLNEQSIAIFAGLTLEENNDQERIGFTGEFQYRFYVVSKLGYNANTTFKGVYVAPYARGRSLTIYREEANGRQGYLIQNFGSGAVLGFRVAKNNRFFMDTFIGGGVKFADDGDFPDASNIWQPTYTGVTPHAGFLIGVSF